MSELEQALTDELPEDYDEDANMDIEEQTALHDEAVEEEKEL